MRVLAIDHGEKRIGVAVSDETGTLASPLTIISHTSRLMDAQRIADLAAEKGAGLILVGQSMDEEGFPNLAGRRAGRFVEQLKKHTLIPIRLWDESLTTQDALLANKTIKKSPGKNRREVDDLAAAILLQSFLEANREA
jgi:putative Holliday junction resolvase